MTLQQVQIPLNRASDIITDGGIVSETQQGLALDLQNFQEQRVTLHPTSTSTCFDFFNRQGPETVLIHCRQFSDNGRLKALLHPSPIQVAERFLNKLAPSVSFLSFFFVRTADCHQPNQPRHAQSLKNERCHNQAESQIDDFAALFKGHTVGKSVWNREGSS